MVLLGYQYCEIRKCHLAIYVATCTRNVRICIIGLMSFSNWAWFSFIRRLVVTLWHWSIASLAAAVRCGCDCWGFHQFEAGLKRLPASRSPQPPNQCTWIFFFHLFVLSTKISHEAVKLSYLHDLHSSGCLSVIARVGATWLCWIVWQDHQEPVKI